MECLSLILSIIASITGIITSICSLIITKEVKNISIGLSNSQTIGHNNSGNSQSINYYE